MKLSALLLSALSASAALYGQLLPSEAASLETAWASGPRQSNALVQIRRGLNKSAPFETTLTDAAGIARTTTKQWELIEIHLPRTTAGDHIACLVVNSKCTTFPVGATLDRKNSIIYWHVPNAYKGDFDLVFRQSGSPAGAVRVTTGSNVVTRLVR